MLSFRTHISLPTGRSLSCEISHRGVSSEHHLRKQMCPIPSLQTCILAVKLVLPPG